MKKIVFVGLVFLLNKVSAQIVFDPTYIHDDAGEFYHHQHIHTLELTFYNPNYHAVLKSWKENNIESTLPTIMNYNGNQYDSVAVKYKGNSTFAVPNSFGNPKLPYNIDLNDYKPGQNIQGYRKMKLGNAYFDPTFAKEVMASYIYKRYMPCYESNLIRLVVNGNYLGVYVNQEDVGNQFLKKHFKENSGPFFKCEPMTEEQAGHPVDLPSLVWHGADTLAYFESYERKSPAGWSEFLNMINVLNNDIANIESVINVDRVLWNFAVTTVLSNEDTYNTTIIHNYYMYQTADGKFQMMPWDLTESFCGILFTGGTPQSHYELDPLYGLSPYFSDRPLVYQLLSQPYYRKKYFSHIRTIINEYYDATFIEDWVLDLQALGYDAVNADPNKPHNMTKFTNNVYDPVNYLLIYQIGGILDVVNNRKPYLLNYPDLTYSSPVISDVSQNIQHPTSSEIVYVSAQVSNSTSVFLRVTNNDEPYASDYLSISMADNGLNGDAVSGDGIYTAQVPFTASNDHIKYYIEAENSNAMKLSPQRAEYFYYHYYIDQVVGEEELVESEFNVYPNPAVDWINVNPGNYESQYTINIYDLQGKLVDTQSDLSGQTAIAVSSYTKGIYLIELTGENFRQTKKITVN
ncbi:MAG: CotH kinase family protein [Crocinitomicaceae bacterium]|nr:CotH kinase family protein [Crocinitomicaceae bacterium]